MKMSNGMKNIHNGEQKRDTYNMCLADLTSDKGENTDKKHTRRA